jgi:hypothetical protein
MIVLLRQVHNDHVLPKQNGGVVGTDLVGSLTLCDLGEWSGQKIRANLVKPYFDDGVCDPSDMLDNAAFSVHIEGVLGCRIPAPIVVPY